MKVAIIIAGHVRNVEATLLHLLKLKNQYNADIYISTYNESGLNHHFWCGELGEDKPLGHEQHLSISLLHPVKVSFNEYESDPNYHYQFRNKELKNGLAVYSMFFKIADAFSLIEKPEEYDVIIRTRFDLRNYTSCLNYKVPEGCCYVAHADQKEYVSDAIFAAGPQDFEKITKIIDRRDSDNFYNAEHLLTDWLNVIDVKPIFGKISAELRDKIFA